MCCSGTMGLFHTVVSAPWACFFVLFRHHTQALSRRFGTMPGFRSVVVVPDLSTVLRNGPNPYRSIRAGHAGSNNCFSVFSIQSKFYPPKRLLIFIDFNDFSDMNRSISLKRSASKSAGYFKTF